MNRLCQQNYLSRRTCSQSPLPDTTPGWGCVSTVPQTEQKGPLGRTSGSGRTGADAAELWVTNSFPKMQPLAPRAAELCEHTSSPGLSIASLHRWHCLSAKANWSLSSRTDAGQAGSSSTVTNLCIHQSQRRHRCRKSGTPTPVHWQRWKKIRPEGNTSQAKAEDAGQSI